MKILVDKNFYISEFKRVLTDYKSLLSEQAQEEILNDLLDAIFEKDEDHSEDE